MMKRIKNYELPQYFYGVVNDNIDDIYCLKEMVEHNELPVPLYDDDHEINGFLCYSCCAVIRDSLNPKYNNDIEVGKLENYCMIPSGEDGFRFFDKEKCLEYLMNHFNIKNKYIELKMEISTDRQNCLRELYNTSKYLFNSLFNDNISDDLLKDIISFGYLKDIINAVGYSLLVKRGYIGKLIEDGYENDMIECGFQSEINEYHALNDKKEETNTADNIDFYI